MERKINIIALYNDNGVGYHRVIKPMQKLQDYYPNLFNVSLIETAKSDKQPLPDLGTTPIDIIYFNTAIGLKETDNLIYYLQLCLMKYNSKIVLDIDDYFEFGNSVIVDKKTKAEHAKRAPEMLQTADYVTTTTAYFANVISKYNKNVEYFHNFYDRHDRQYTINREPAINADGKRVVRIGFTSSAFHKEDFLQLSSVTALLKKKCPNNPFKIVLCGYTPNQYYKDYEKILTSNYNICNATEKRILKNYSITDIELPTYQRIKWLPTGDYMRAYNKFDVLVAPLKDNPFNACKSPIKYVEAASMGVLFVGSNTPAYNSVVSHGVNGFLCKGNEWTATLSKIINNWDDGYGFKHIIDNASEDAFNLYEAEVVTAQRKDFFLKITQNY